jgi:hypothetical protein
VNGPQVSGVCAFGRRKSRRAVEPDGTIRKRITVLPREEWGIVIHDHHPG